jgi:2-keto-4-pentenoate hydratase
MMFKSFYVCLTTIALLAGCSSGQNSPPTLTSNSDPAALAHHMFVAREERVATTAIPALFPELDRETAYQVQMLTLNTAEGSGAKVVGWKLGGTVLKTPEAVPDPVFGFSLDSQLLNSGASPLASRFVNGDVLVEAEITFVISNDLTGPVVTRENVIAAIESVCGSIELIDERMFAISEDKPKSMAHIIADGVSHGGAILGPKRVNLEDIDIINESVTVTVNGEMKSTGYSRYLMRGDAIAPVVWLANALLEQGRYLKAGDFVQTGSLYDNPTLVAGDRAEVEFSSLGKLEFELKADSSSVD